MFNQISRGGYLLVALHQFQCLTFNIIFPPDDVGEDSWKYPAVKFGGRNLDVELASILVLQVKLDVILLCALSAIVATCLKGGLTPELCAVLVGVFCSLLVGRARNIE